MWRGQGKCSPNRPECVRSPAHRCLVKKMCNRALMFRRVASDPTQVRLAQLRGQTAVAESELGQDTQGGIIAPPNATATRSRGCLQGEMRFRPGWHRRTTRRNGCGTSWCSRCSSTSSRSAPRTACSLQAGTPWPRENRASGCCRPASRWCGCWRARGRKFVRRKGARSTRCERRS